MRNWWRPLAVGLGFHLAIWGGATTRLWLDGRRGAAGALGAGALAGLIIVAAVGGVLAAHRHAGRAA